MREKIVCVEWEDASYNIGYYDKKSPEDFTPTFTRTVGHFIKRSKEGIILSVDRFYDNSEKKVTDNRHITIIPNKMIMRIIELAEK